MPSPWPPTTPSTRAPSSSPPTATTGPAPTPSTCRPSPTRSSVSATSTSRAATRYASQSRGPAPDGRFKPDIQAPTNSETASNAQRHRPAESSAGTSGATPYAAGAAALLRNWLRGPSGSIDPGQVYAQLILSGQRPVPVRQHRGLRRPIELPTNGWAWWGKVSVSNGQTHRHPHRPSAASAPTRFDAALWWPEGGFRIFGFEIDFHSDIDLSLIDPGGSTRASSISIPSVFERVACRGPRGGRDLEAPHPRLPRAALVADRLLGRPRQDELNAAACLVSRAPRARAAAPGHPPPARDGADAGGRDRLPFALVRAGADDVPIYGPTAEAALAAAGDQDVEVAGKLIDRRRGAPGRRAVGGRRIVRPGDRRIQPRLSLTRR